MLQVLWHFSILLMVRVAEKILKFKHFWRPHFRSTGTLLLFVAANGVITASLALIFPQLESANVRPDAMVRNSSTPSLHPHSPAWMFKTLWDAKITHTFPFTTVDLLYLLCVCNHFLAPCLRALQGICPSCLDDALISTFQLFLSQTEKEIIARFRLA